MGSSKQIIAIIANMQTPPIMTQASLVLSKDAPTTVSMVLIYMKSEINFIIIE
jgi:hypothetical protein